MPQQTKQSYTIIKKVQSILYIKYLAIGWIDWTFII